MLYDQQGGSISSGYFHFFPILLVLESYRTNILSQLMQKTVTDVQSMKPYFLEENVLIRLLQ